MMLVEEKMQLVEGTTSYLPVVFLYISRRVMVSARTWLRFSVLARADSSSRSNWQLGDLAVWLDFEACWC
jgi:hypothetical protein